MFEVGQVVELLWSLDIVNEDDETYDFISEGERGTITEIDGEGVWVKFDAGVCGVRPEWIEVVDETADE